MEYAHLLVNGYHSGDAEITQLLERVRVVVVPLINADGFYYSRGTFDPGDAAVEFLGDDNDIQFVESLAPPGPFAYKRKNCASPLPPEAPCDVKLGVDPNRNYGEGWGGNGASMNPVGLTYRGPGPWSEPETQAVHEFSQNHQVTTIVTLHNVAALVLRPPGRRADGLAPDEPRMKELGQQMADATGYTNQYGWQLYDTSGTTEDWNYAAQGAYGYTIEIGPKNGNFHMAYETGVVNEWNGTGTRDGRGLREALMVAAKAAANPNDHAVIAGEAPAGRVLRVRKDFVTKTSDVCEVALDEPLLDRCEARSGVREIPDFLETTTVVPASGVFEWHVNPSTRPFVGWKRELGEVVSNRTETFGPGDEGPKTPRVITESTEEEDDAQLDESSYIREFTVTPEDDAGVLRVALSWPGNAEDYDLRLYFKEPDGTLRPAGNGTGGYLPDGTQLLTGGGAGSSGNPPGFSETVEVLDPPVGTYVAKVVSYAATGAAWELTVERLFKEPDVFTDLGTREAWTLSCLSSDGKTLYGSRQVSVERGERAVLDLGKTCKAPKKQKGR